MNRGIALFVALVLLLAHTLAIHADEAGAFAVPYDVAYVPFRLARNLVYDGQLVWNLSAPAFESHGSPLWIAVCATAERIAPFLHLSTNLLVQSVGIACTLGAVVLVARFRADRSASLIAPLFLAASGTAAALAASGLEIGLVMLLATGAFLALERGRSRTFALLAALLCLAQQEALVLVLGMLAIRLFGKPNDDEGEARQVAIGSFVAPIAVTALMALVRWRISGFILPPSVHDLAHLDAEQIAGGTSTLRDFFLAGVSPLLLVFPAVYLVRGSLSRTGSHAVFLALVWMALVVAQGRSALPFSGALAPALPLVFLGVQEGMIATLDGISVFRRRLTLLVFGAGLLGSVLASRSPGDLGPIPLARLYSVWLGTALSTERIDGDAPLARASLQEEIAVTGRLRKAGIYLRDQAEPGATILTPWPGAIGYLSRQTVYDVLGRTDPLRPLDRPRAWTHFQRADVVSQLERGADYVVPFSKTSARARSLADVAHAWAEGLDEIGGPAREAEIARALAAYELLTIPIEDYTRSGTALGRETFVLLRSRRLGGRPRLDAGVDADGFHITVRHSGPPQIADLLVEIEDDTGRSSTLRPTLDLDPSRSARARVNILLYDSGTRGIELVSGPLPPAPAGSRWSKLRARLANPASDAQEPFGSVSDEVVVAIP